VLSIFHSASTFLSTALRLSALALACSCFVSCGGTSAKYETGAVMPVHEGVDAKAVWQEAGYEIAHTGDGALPSVEADLGGDGFAALAVDQGWQTREDYPRDGSKDALPGGRIRMHITEYPATLRSEGKDAHTAFQQMMIKACYETLLEVNDTDLQYQPALATHWKVLSREDGKQEIWFRLNPDARWQTGHRVTAQDVVASWRLKVDDGLLRVGDALVFREFTEPEAISPYILRTISDKVSWRQMMSFATQMVIYPAHIIADLTGKEYMERFQNASLPGSGHYLIQEKDVRQGNSLELTRVANYWDRHNPMKVGEWNFYKIKFVTVAEENLAREKTKKGELDLYHVNQAKYWVRELTPERVKQIEKGWLCKQRIFNDQPNGMQGFVLNTREAPFDDIRVREAFSYLVDRATMIDKLFLDQYFHQDSFYPGSKYANSENPIIRHDPARAIRLLEEAGYTRLGEDGVRMNSLGERLEIELMSSESATSERLLTVICENLMQGGFLMHLKPTTFSTRIKMLNDRKFKIYYGAWTGSNFPDPRLSWHSEFALGPDTGNHPGVVDARIDSLVSLYDVEPNQAKREALLREVDLGLMQGFYLSQAWYGPYDRMIYWNKFGMPECCLPRSYDYRALIRLWWYDSERHAALREAIETDTAQELKEVDVHFWD
jgi:microcin C transport system substrate-binding protein